MCLLKQVRKRQNNRFYKRRDTLFTKAKQICALGEGDTNIYILINYGGKYYIYTSTDATAWPPSPNKIVGYFFLLKELY
jgi:hypothetical protein